MNKAIGILGGTFDPIHNGHIKPALQLAEQLDLAEVRVMPSHIPPHKTTTKTASEHRAAMVKLACDSHSVLVPDLRELERNTPSYTAITLGSFRQDMPDTPLCFMMGMDSLLSFKRWYRWEHILEQCHLVVSCRPGWRLDPKAEVTDLISERATQDPALLHQSLNGVIYLAAIDEIDMSSSQIRQACREGQSIAGWLPEPVQQYLEKHNIYNG